MSIVCLVTSGAGASVALVDRMGEAARAGVDLIQIRERALDDRTLTALTRDAVAAVRGTGARVVVNGRVDVAMAAGAGGVHLRGDSIPASKARSLTPAGFTIGRSVHSADEAAAAEREGGCDYLTFGTVFASASKPNVTAAGLDALRRVCARVRLPVLAIGGVSIARAPVIASAGASGVAAIGLFTGAGDLADSVRALRNAFDT